MKKLHKIILVIIVVVPLLILWILSDTHKRHYRIAKRDSGYVVQHLDYLGCWDEMVYSSNWGRTYKRVFETVRDARLNLYENVRMELNTSDIWSDSTWIFESYIAGD
jgi:hypothetical protein